MGTQAEAAFVRWAGPRIIQRVGWDKSPLPREAFWDMPPEIRHLPDFFLFDERLFWVEVIGTANLAGFKIRKTKLESQKMYHDKVPLFYFVYHSPSDSYATIGWDTVHSGAHTPQKFADGNSYYFLEVNSWTPLRSAPEPS